GGVVAGASARAARVIIACIQTDYTRTLPAPLRASCIHRSGEPTYPGGTPPPNPSGGRPQQESGMRFHQHSPDAAWGSRDATIQSGGEPGAKVDDTRFPASWARAGGGWGGGRGVPFDLPPRDARPALRLGRIFPPHARVKSLTFRHHEAA